MERARAALAAGRWDDARAACEASLADSETPEALEGLGRALWWLCEARESARHRERAFVLYRQAGDRERACELAVDLVVTYLVNLGNGPAARGWLARAERVAQPLEHSPTRGWLWLMRGYLTSDSGVASDFLQRALDFARERSDPDLELVALGDLGVNLVMRGEIDDGMAMLDEAMAGSMAGECRRPEVVVYNCCSMLAACRATGDTERAAQWCRVADEFMRQHTCPFLFARCRVHYGSLLLTRGEWDRAETELRAALGMAADAGPAPRAEAMAGLAELRLRQGRLEEAEALLATSDLMGPAARPAAELRLAHGDPSAAVALVQRRLAHVSGDPLEAVRATALLVDAQIVCGDLEAAEEVCRRLDELAKVHGGAEPESLSAFASAHLLSAHGREEEALTRLEEALEGFASADLPFETGRVRLRLAHARAVRSPAIAAAEARSALRAFERIGATAAANDAAALLRSLGQRVRHGAGGSGALPNREQEVLRLVATGLSNPEIAERLFISRRTAAHHVSNILMKLGLTRRAELAAYSARVELEDDSGRVGVAPFPSGPPV